MVAQQVETLNHDFLDSLEGQMAAARAQLGSMEQWIATAARDGVAAHEVERSLFDGLLRLGHLRAVSASGDWDVYQRFRIASENQRLYPNKRTLHESDWPFPIAV